MQVYVFGFQLPGWKRIANWQKNWANFLKLILQYFIEKKIIVQCARNKKLKTSENNKDNLLQVRVHEILSVIQNIVMYPSVVV